MIVADTNLLAYLLLPGTASAAARRAFLKDPLWAAPMLWRSELRNVFAKALHDRQLEVADANEVMELALDVVAGREYEVDSAAVLRLAAESGCTAYDCEFVALALDLEVPLVTSDRVVLRRFPTVARSLRSFAG